VLKRQAKQGAAGIQHDIGKLYDLKNNIGEPQTIGVVGSQPNDSLQDTFLHEVLHAICHVMGLRETEKEENFVRRLAQDCARCGTTTLRRSSGGAGWFSCQRLSKPAFAAVFAEEVGC